MPTRHDRSQSWKRIGWILGSTIGVIVSLLTFPNAIAWMIAGWLLCYVVLALQSRRGWLPLATCVAILLAKNMDWSPALILLAAVMLACGLWRGWLWQRAGDGRIRRADWMSIAALTVAWLVFTWNGWTSTHCGRNLSLPAERPVACIGDSLTAFGYPEHLAKMITIPVVDHGANGITSGEGLARLPALIDAQPAVVVIELGGHDFLKGKSRAETKANLQKMINACRTIDAEVILMEIPRGFIVDPYGGLERELAGENDLELIPDSAIRKLVLWSPFEPPGMWLDSEHHLSDDGLHPNTRGNRFLANCVADALVRMYGSQVRVQ